MIASHDSFTYLKPRLSFMRLFAWLWKTQTKTIQEQIDSGVRYFDVRVRRVSDGWRVCHGLVDLDMTFRTISDILNFFKGYKFRLVLERGDDTLFRYLTPNCWEGVSDSLTAVIIKKGWEVLYRENKDEHIIDLSYTPFLSDRTLWQNLKKLRLSTPKRYARKMWQRLPDDAEQSDTVYFMDYV